MPSPFPGMDPYLEDPDIWKDFHADLLRHWRDQLDEQLPPAYVAQLHERERLIELSREQARRVVPDLEGMIQKRLGRNDSLELDLNPHDKRVAITQRFQIPYLAIRRKTSRKLVTIIEVFLPGTKSYCGGHDYMDKRKAQLKEPIHLVELDLIIGGYRLPGPETDPEGDYYALIWRRKQRPCEIVAWSLREPFPSIPIPLREPDPDFEADLNKVFAAAYDGGGYARRLKYDDSPPAPLTMGDQFWAVERARGQGPTTGPQMPPAR